MDVFVGYMNDITGGKLSPTKIQKIGKAFVDKPDLLVTLVNAGLDVNDEDDGKPPGQYKLDGKKLVFKDSDDISD